MRTLLAALFILPFACAAQVSVQEYPIPKGLFAHDPKTGKVETVALGRGSSPHGVIMGPDGGVWLTDGGQNAIVRVDLQPSARQVKVWELPPDTGYTGKFESFKSSSSSANVRQIHGRKGEVWTPESAADKLVVYRYK